MIGPEDWVTNDVLQEAAKRSPALLEKARVDTEPFRGQADDAAERVL